MAIAGFEQDPGAMPGMGWVSDEFGNKRYLFAPQVAQQFGGGQQQQPPQEPDQRLAMGPMASAQAGKMQPDYAGGQQRQGQSVSMSDAPAFNATTPPAEPRNAATAANAATGGGAPANLSEAITNQSMNDIGQAMLRERNQRPRSVGEKFIPKSKEESVEKQGRPIEPGELEQVAQPFNERADARYKQGQLDAQQKYGEAVDAFSALPKQYAAQAAAQKKKDEIDARVAQTMAEVDENARQAEQAPKDFDPNRLFSGKNAAAGIGAAIFRAMGAYAQAKGRLQNNAAGDIIDAAIQRDIEQQKEQIAATKGNVDNALKRLTLYRGDQEHAAKELEAYMTSWTQGRMRASAAAVALPQVQVGMEKDMADLEAKKQEALGAIKDRSYGLHAEKVEQKYVPAHTEGGQLSVDQTLTRAGKYANVLETLNKANATGQPKAGDVQKYGEEMDKIDQADRAIRAYISSAGGQVAENGQVAFPNGTNLRRNPATGHVIESVSNNSQVTALKQAALAVGHLQAGARLPPEMLDTYQATIAGRDDKDAANAATLRLRELEARKADLRKRFGASAEAGYNAGAGGGGGATQGVEEDVP